MNTTIFNDEMQHLKIELLSNGLVRLENELMGESYMVDVHPTQLRYIAEKMGLMRKLSPSEAALERTVTELQRRLLALKERIDHIGGYLALHSDHRHADLSYETNYATATADICEAYCADFVEPKPRPDISAATPVNSGQQSGSCTADGAKSSQESRPVPSQLDLTA